jgi:hypothetical protein
MEIPNQLPLGRPGKTYLNTVNSRIVRLSGDVLQFTPILTEDKEIVELAGPEMSYKIGQVIKPKARYPFKINHIHKISNGVSPIGYDFTYARQNLSSIFAAPLLGGRRDLFLWDKNFINAFIATPDDEDVIALLYRFSGEPLFLKFEAALEAFRTFKYKIDTDSYHVLFVFDVPDGAKSSYDHFINSRYSEIDDIVKLKILDYHSFTMDGQTAKVLFKSPSLREELQDKLNCTIPEGNELHSVLDMNQERFDPDYYHTPKSIIERKKIY